MYIKFFRQSTLKFNNAGAGQPVMKILMIGVEHSPNKSGAENQHADQCELLIGNKINREYVIDNH